MNFPELERAVLRYAVRYSKRDAVKLYALAIDLLSGDNCRGVRRLSTHTASVAGCGILR